MQRRRRIAGGLFAWVCLAAAFSVAAQEPVLRWAVQDTPPHFNYLQGRPPSGPDELGTGRLEIFLRLLLRRLPQYRHELLDLNASRFETLTAAGESLCSIQLLRTPSRERWLYFSPLFPAPSTEEFRAVMRRSLADKLASELPSQGGRVALADLLQRADLRLLLGRDRQFTAPINDLLAPIAVPRIAINGWQAHRLLDMVRAGRVDYTIEYASVAKSYIGGLDDPGELVSLPLVEGPITAYISAACSRNDAGRRQIEAIDAALRALASDPEREAWLREWRAGRERGDPAEHKRLNKYFDERARGGPRID